MELRSQLGPAQTSNERSNSAIGTIKGTFHLIGIGGIGMSALARLLLAKGKSVSGSDKQESSITKELASLGAKIFIGHKAENISGAEALVVSTAIVEDNPELTLAHQKKIPIWHRSDILAYLSKDTKLIGVSGTHGKTTTTGMIAQIMIDVGMQPSVVIGGIFNRIGANAYCGNGNFFVAEIDESDRTQVSAQPYISVITNIEADHLENYPGGLKQIYEVMATFADNSRHAVILCLEDNGCRTILPLIEKAQKNIIAYGKHNTSKQFDYSYSTIEGTGVDGFSMQVFKDDNELGIISLAIPGEHNRLNAMAAVATCLELEVPFEGIAQALAQFTGVDRRFQLIGKESEILIVDDYAHHPTEVAATLQAAKNYIKTHHDFKRVVAIFQPHQPGRLRDLWDEFCRSFTSADLVLLLDVYVARGMAIKGITSEEFSKSILHNNVRYLKGSVKNLAEQVIPHLQPHDLVLTIGAGDITQLGPELLKHLRQKHHGTTR